MDIQELKENNVLSKVSKNDISHFMSNNTQYIYFYQKGQSKIPDYGYLGVFKDSNMFTVLSPEDDRISKYNIVDYKY